MLEAEKEQLVRIIFSEREMFEQYILSVHSEEDREDIMVILSKMMIRTILKDEFNFLYMGSINKFDFSLIVNLLFKEFANEWVSYAEDKLAYKREDALSEIQNKSRVLFILSVSKWYFRKYKSYFAEHIADSFIELVDLMPNATLNNELIQYVLRSGFVRKNSISTVLNYNQLWNRVKNAHDNKNEQLTKLQIQINEIVKSEDLSLLKKYELEAELLENKSLAFFDDAVMRLRETMIEYMIHIEKIVIR